MLFTFGFRFFASLLLPLWLLVVHVGVAEVFGRQEGFFDGSRGDPSFEIEPAAGFVVCAGCPCSAERLLGDDGARGLVVYVEIASGVAQRVHRLYNGSAVQGEYRAGQRVRRRLGDVWSQVSSACSYSPSGYT